MIFLTSDPHYGHENIIKYTGRPFHNKYEMNEALIKNWNDMVTQGDTVIFLGDFALGSIEYQRAIRARLNGNIIWIRGNHDGTKQRYAECVEVPVDKIYDFIILEWTDVASRKKYVMNLSHYPLFQYNMTREELGRSMKIPNRLGKQVHTMKIMSDTIYSTGEVNQLVDRPDRINLCGHVHEKWKSCKNSINVGVDQWGFKPVSLDMLVDYWENNCI